MVVLRLGFRWFVIVGIIVNIYVKYGISISYKSFIVGLFGVVRCFFILEFGGEFWYLYVSS